MKTKTLLVVLVVVLALGFILQLDNKRKDRQLDQIKQELTELEKQLQDPTPLELDMLKVVEVARARGLSDSDIRIALQIIQLESGFNGNEIAVNNHGGFYSLDIGYWQINSYYQSEIAGKYADRICLMDIECSTHKAIDIFEQWGNWTAWTTYNFIINK